MSETTEQKLSSLFKNTEEVKAWLFDLLDMMRYRRPQWDEYIVKCDDEKGIVKLKLWTDRHHYVISIGFKENDYISCVATARRQRPGETFFRNNDLYNGRLNEESFNRVMLDIVSYELVSIWRNKKKSYDKDNNNSSYDND